MDEQMNFSILINGVDVTSYTNLGLSRPVITSAIDEELDTMTVMLFDADDANLQEWQEVVVLDGTEKIFGGYILTIDKTANLDGKGNDYALSCADYGARMDRCRFRLQFNSESTDQAIIAAAFGEFSELSSWDVSTSVASIITIPRHRFNRVSLRELMDWLCERSGGHWYVDYDKKLHYFASEEFLATFNVTDNPSLTSKATVEDFKVLFDGTSVANLVEVVGGNYLSEDLEDLLASGGVSKSVQMINRMQPPEGETSIQVIRNDGGAATNLVVNPSFENNISDGWTQFQSGSGGVWASDSSQYYFGLKSLKITAGTARVGVRGTSITLNAGESISVQTMAKTSVLAAAELSIYNVGGSADLATCESRKVSQWERLVCSYTNTSGATMTVRIELRNEAANSSTTVYFDGAQAEKTSWASGYIDGTLGTGYAWSGTAHNSTSTRVEMPVWTEMTVKTGNTQELESVDEVLYFEKSARLEQENTWPRKSDAVKVIGKYDIPVRVRSRNQASHDHYGMWLETKIVDNTIIDLQVAVMRAKTELLKYATASPCITYLVRNTGLRAGMTQSIDMVARDVLGKYLINRVTTTVSTGGYISAEVELGAVDLKLVGLILKIKRNSSKDVEWDDSEVLDEILDTTEDLELNDNSIDFEWLWDTACWDRSYWTWEVVRATQGPYVWDTACWDLSAWS